MGRISTSIIPDISDKKETVRDNGPKTSTIEFLKQFARVYSFEPKLKQDLGTIIAN